LITLATLMYFAPPMWMRGNVAMKIAIEARLFPMPVARGGARVVRGFVLEYGPESSPDAIVTIACRRMLALEESSFDESDVAELVSGYGFVYTGLVGVQSSGKAGSSVSLLAS
jgi:hypothetical protein